MDYEQKYKEALNKAQRLSIDGFLDAVAISDIFPELKESEDEKIKKTIIRFFKDNYPNETEMYDGSVTVGKALAWLEKQGEKTTDKIEPNPAWSEEDEEILKWLCRIIHSQRMSKEITLKEESELGEWMDKWLNHNPQTKQGKQLENYDEDERIRKALIEMIHDTTGDECEDCYHVSKESVLSWLEKQGEKKNTRKREIHDAYLQGVCDTKHEIEKQGKKLDADNVWLRNYMSNVTRFVNQFKKDFGL